MAGSGLSWKRFGQGFRPPSWNSHIIAKLEGMKASSKVASGWPGERANSA